VRFYGKGIKEQNKFLKNVLKSKLFLFDKLVSEQEFATKKYLSHKHLNKEKFLLNVFETSKTQLPYKLTFEEPQGLSRKADNCCPF